MRKSINLKKGILLLQEPVLLRDTNSNLLKSQTTCCFLLHPMIRYRVKSKIANPFYIGYLLKSYEWKGFVQNVMSGSAATPVQMQKQFADFLSF